MGAQTAKQICIAKKADGTPCRRYAYKGSQLCLFHDKSKADKAKLAQVLGGLSLKKQFLKLGEKETWRDASVEDMDRAVSEIFWQLTEGKIANGDPVQRLLYVIRTKLEVRNYVKLEDEIAAMRKEIELLKQS